MDKPLGVILAGGQSRRMGGGDKALLDLGGQPLMARVIDRLRPQVGALAINANGDPARYGGFALPVIGDSIAGFPGPLAGVLAGLDWAAGQGATHIVTAAADTPFFPADLVATLLAEQARQGTAVILAATLDRAAKHGLRRHPTFGLWPVALGDELRAALAKGVRKVVQWTDAVGCGNALIAADPFDPFFNINTPEDRAHAEALVAKGVI